LKEEQKNLEGSLNSSAVANDPSETLSAFIRVGFFTASAPKMAHAASCGNIRSSSSFSVCHPPKNGRHLILNFGRV
jgi:hypothetical protein